MIHTANVGLGATHPDSDRDFRGPLQPLHRARSRDGSVVRRVLVVEDDEFTLAVYETTLHRAGFQVLTARDGHAGLSIGLSQRVDAITLDLRLPDVSGLEVLRQLRAGGAVIPVVVVTGFATVPSTVEAMRLGAAGVVEKPLFGDDIVRVVEATLVSDPPTTPMLDGRETTAPRFYASLRWASVVVGMIESATDPTTLCAWGRLVGASGGCLRSWCRTLGLSPRRSLLFARLLRATHLARTQGLGPEECLDIAELRTLAKLLRLGGSTTTPPTLAPDEQDFLRLQRLIQHRTALVETARQLKIRGHWPTP